MRSQDFDFESFESYVANLAQHMNEWQESQEKLTNQTNENATWYQKLTAVTKEAYTFATGSKSNQNDPGSNLTIAGLNSTESQGILSKFITYAKGIILIPKAHFQFHIF